MTSALATLGHNNPPAPTAYEAVRDEIEGLYAEAAHWLDGSGVQSEADAEGVSCLLDLIRKAETRADEARREEARPHDEAKAEVQAKYAPLIGNTKSVKGKTVLAAECCKRALVPWLAAQEAAKRATAEAARREAEAAAERARAAFGATDVTDLAGRAEAEALAQQAQAAEAAARRADKDKAAARGGARAVTLRTTHRAEVTDARAFARWAWTHRQDELAGLLQSLAERLCSAGLRELPGVTIHEERVAR